MLQPGSHLLCLTKARANKVLEDLPGLWPTYTPGHDNRRGPGKRAVGPPSRTTGPGCYFAALQKYQSSATQLKSGFWGLKPQTFFATSLNSRAVSGCQMTGRFFARKFS